MKKSIIFFSLLLISLIFVSCSSAKHINDPDVQSAIEMMRFDNHNFDATL